tara:strand:+ start:188 stop:442 length:255 start_codon:yes stop_codon:yes gene_type:complete
MVRTFQNEKTGILFNLDTLSQHEFLKLKIARWLEQNHEDIFYDDIEFQEGGKIHINTWADGSQEIRISGDNGVLIFDECDIPTL